MFWCYTREWTIIVQTALIRGACNVSLFWLWFMMANVMLHKMCFSKDFSLTCMVVISLFQPAVFFNEQILNAFLSKQVKWDCSQMLFFDALNLLVMILFRRSKVHGYLCKVFLFGLIFCTFVVVKCFRIKFIMSWVDFCLFRTLEWFSSFVDCIFCFVPFLTLSLGSWLTC